MGTCGDRDVLYETDGPGPDGLLRTTGAGNGWGGVANARADVVRLNGFRSTGFDSRGGTGGTS